MLQQCEFFVTTSEDALSQRSIVAASDQVIERYAIGTSIIELPWDDLRMLYDLQAWEFPGCYLESDLNETVVKITAEGDYVIAP